MEGVKGFLYPKKKGIILVEETAHLRGIGRGVEMGVGQLRAKEVAIDGLVRPIGGAQEWEFGVDIKLDVLGVDKNVILIRDEEGGGIVACNDVGVFKPMAMKDQVVDVD